ncbi:hypothetical protein [Aminipila sp.]|uniref:hypothetical protein n=1 Tax=Aminipila sp. TaxID=2060095 RepID=UPI00289D6642|nr:hypothetical protein [Aminipila sp.]
MRYKNIIMILVVMVMCSFLNGCFPLNTPREYTLANDVGEPLDVGQTWNEEGKFNVTVNDITEVPLTNLDISKEDLKYYRTNDKIVKALDIQFDFENINYSSFKEDGGKIRKGLFFYLKALGYDDKGNLVNPVPLESTSDGVFNYPYGENDITIGKSSRVNHYVVLIADEVKKVKINFSTYKDSEDYRYEKNFAYEVSSISPIENNYDMISAYLEKEFKNVYNNYYEILDLIISQYEEKKVDGKVQATFLYTMIHKNFDRDPESVAYIKEAKKNKSPYYEQMCKEYLEPQEANYEFMVEIDQQGKMTLYTNISPKATEWKEVQVSDFILKD